RQWPDKLQVIIEEQIPIAKWDSAGFVNNRGELVLTDVGQLLDHLPVLKGNADEALELMQQYQQLSELFSNSALTIQTLEKNSIGIWLLTLSNGWQLIAGRDNVAKKTHQFLVMIEQNVIANPEQIQQVDMRYRGGLAIQWRPLPSFESTIPGAEQAKANTSGVRAMQENEG
ncbi:MAG: cell division protein FtsQ/DivIB, partial [Pseudomonadota bacterium]